MPDDDGIAGAERFDQRERIPRQGFLVSVSSRDRGGMVAAHVRADGTVAPGGKARTKIVPGMRRVGEPVQQED